MSGPTHTPNEEEKIRDALAGRWRKVSDPPCAQTYPDHLEFFGSRYLAKKGPEQRFTVWDAGIIRVEGPGRIRISTATDELVLYTFSLSGDALTVVDQDGCELVYHREQ